MADLGYQVLLSVLTLDGIDFEHPRSGAKTSYVGFLLLPSCGVLFSAAVVMLLALRRSVHLILTVTGYRRRLNAENFKAFCSLVLFVLALAYSTIGVPHAFASGNPRVTGMPLGVHALMTTVATMCLVGFALACLIDPKDVNRNLKL